MAREIEADGVELVLQPLDRAASRRAAGKGAPVPAPPPPPPNRLTWPAAAVVGRGRGVAQQHLDGGEALRAVGVEPVEGAGLDQAFELAAVEALGVEPPGEIEQILERSVGLALRDELASSPGRRRP